MPWPFHRQPLASDLNPTNRVAQSLSERSELGLMCVSASTSWFMTQGEKSGPCFLFPVGELKAGPPADKKLLEIDDARQFLMMREMRALGVLVFILRSKIAFLSHAEIGDSLATHILLLD